MGKNSIRAEDDMNFPKIGMRNIKTSTSVFLCLLLFQFINRENAVHACIAAIICMQNTLDDSFKKGMERVIGTIMGGIAGAFVVFYIETFGHEQYMVLIIPFGIMLLIEICVALKLKQSVVICCVVFLSILISKEHEGGYVLYTFNRVVDTTAGIMVTIFVNKYMNVPEELKKLVKIRKNTESSNREITSNNEEKDKNEKIENIQYLTKEQVKNNGEQQCSGYSGDIETVEKK